MRVVEPVAEKSAFPWRQTLKRRLLVAALVLVAWSAVIEARLVYLQVGRHADLSARAERQQSRVCGQSHACGFVRIVDPANH